jgi:hypothetical protein
MDTRTPFKSHDRKGVMVPASPIVFHLVVEHIKDWQNFSDSAITKYQGMLCTYHLIIKNKVQNSCGKEWRTEDLV